MPYEPIDNDEDAVEFDVAQIEQMKVELSICPLCSGQGQRNSGFYWYDCPSCGGTGNVVKKSDRRDSDG